MASNYKFSNEEMAAIKVARRETKDKRADARLKALELRAAGSKEHTEVYVVSEQDFMRWYEAEKTFPDEGVKLHAQTTFWPEKAIPKQG